MIEKSKFGFLPGVFDLIHRGHIHMLKNAKNRCDYLIVAIHTDECVQQYKNKVPIFKLEDRIELVKSIQYVDTVVVLNTLNPFEFVKNELKDYRPLLMFHGTDWLPEGWVECQEQLEGVSVLQLPLLYGQGVSTINEKNEYSTSGIIQKIISGR